MTAFEYITVLISIILGMGITQIITGIADMITQWNKVKVYWPHLLWVAFVFFLHIQDWWQTFNLQEFTFWKLSTFMVLILYPINLFILARLLFPFGQDQSTNSVDFKEFYFNNYRKFFLWLVILSLLSIIINIFIDNYSWHDQLAPASIFICLGFIAWRDIRSVILHQVIAISLFIIILSVLMIKDFQIGN